jgi:hypothetical protein
MRFLTIRAKLKRDGGGWALDVKATRHRHLYCSLDVL